MTPPALAKVGVLGSRRAVRARFLLSEPGSVTVRLLRRRRLVRSKTFEDRGTGVGTVAVTRVKPGRYSVRLGATDAAGLDSARVRRKVVVRR